MKNIRKGVFETNSSSSHSICISNKGQLENGFYLNDEGKIEIHPGEFGWEIDSFRDCASKASYCLTRAKNDGENGNNDKLTMLKNVIEDFTGKEVVFVESYGAYYKWGYIDHQSFDVCDEAFESEENLKNFIFNSKSILVTDNDNH